jgi:hypothetical protein
MSNLELHLHNRGMAQGGRSRDPGIRFGAKKEPARRCNLVLRTGAILVVIDLVRSAVGPARAGEPDGARGSRGRGFAVLRFPPPEGKSHGGERRRVGRDGTRASAATCTGQEALKWKGGADLGRDTGCWVGRVHPGFPQHEPGQGPPRKACLAWVWRAAALDN